MNTMNTKLKNPNKIHSRIPLPKVLKRYESGMFNRCYREIDQSYLFKNIINKNKTDNKKK